MKIISELLDKKNRYKLALFLITISALLIRIKYFGIHRFAMDEALYAGWAQRVYHKLDILFNGVPEIDKPPVLFYLQAICYGLFGVSENSARFPNLIAGIGNVILVYKLGKYYFNRSTGLIAAFLLALSPYCIAYDNSAYLDTLYVFWGLLGLYLITVNKYLYAGIAIGMSFASKQFGILFIPLVVLAVYLQLSFNTQKTVALWAPEIKTFLKGLGWVIVVLLFISIFANPPLGFLIRQFHNQSQLVEAVKEPVGQRYLSWFKMIGDLFWLNWIRSIFFILIPITLFFTFGKAIRKHLDKGTGFYLLMFLFVAVYISMISVVRFEFYPRYLMLVAPFLIIMIAVPVAGIIRFVSRIPVPQVGKTVVALLIAAMVIMVIMPIRNQSTIKLKNGAFDEGNDGIDHAAWYIKSKMGQRPILFTDDNATAWALKFYCYGYEFEKVMWVTKGDQIRDLVNQFPDNAKYMLWRGDSNQKALEKIKNAGMVSEPVFKAYGGDPYRVKFTIAKLIKKAKPINPK